MSGERQYWADYTKAFAIWLMVLGHFLLRPVGFVDFINEFHMPVFFLISGFFNKGESFSFKVLKKNFLGTMIPYFFFNICSLSICWISPYVHPELYHNGTLSETFIKALVGMFLMEDNVRPYAFMPTGALWFLVALFNIRIIFAFLCLFWRRCKAAILIVCAFGIFVVRYSFPFFSLDSAFVSLPFFIVGYLIKKYGLLDRITKKWQILLVAILFWIYTAVLGVRNGRISIDGCMLGKSILLFYFNGIIGSLACVLSFRLISIQNNFFQTVGSSTLTILGTHGYIDKLMVIIGVLLWGGGRSDIPLWFIVLFSIIALLFGVYVNKFLVTHCPMMVGKPRKAKA